MSAEENVRTRSVAETALARGEDHRVSGDLEAAEEAYFEAALAAARAAGGGTGTARHVTMRARIGLGRIELMGTAPDRALGWFLSARDAAPEHWEPLYWQGCAQAWLGDYPGADRSFTAALRSNPGESIIRVQRCYARFKMGDLPGALADMPAPEECALDDTALLVLASLRLEQGAWSASERILRILLDRNPANVRGHELMGVAFERRGRPDDAVTCYTRAAGLGRADLARARLDILRAGTGHARALRADPADGRALHAVSARWLSSTREFGDDHAPVPVGIAAVAALLHDERFWERFRSGAAARYQTPVPASALVTCRSRIKHRAIARAGPRHEVLLLREIAATGALRDLGGLPTGGDQPGPLVCGPLMISLLGLERTLGDLVARRTAPDDPPAGRWRRLRRLFSALGGATALLEAERTAEALAALEGLACDRCRGAVAGGDEPAVCRPECPDFDLRNPGYARLPGKGRRLAEDAVRLSIAARLGLAHRIVTTDPDDADGLARLWADAVRAAVAVGAQEPVIREIADTALGRAKVLGKRDRLATAITLVSTAEQVLGGGSAVGEELRGQLAELLTDQGVIAANKGELEDARSDLRRAAHCSPHSSRPLVNLSIVLQRLADRRRDLGDNFGAYELLREAKRVLEAGGAQLRDSPKFAHQLGSVHDELGTLCNRWAIELATGGHYEEALDIVDRGLAELPEDARLRTSRQNIRMAAERPENHGQVGS